MKLSVRLLSGCVISLACMTASADTLREIYELALENDAQLKAQEATYRANLEVEKLGLSALLPQVSGTYEYTDSDTDTDAQSFDTSGDPDDPIRAIDTSTNVDVDRDGYQVSLNQARTHQMSL